jgi:predicted nucleotidyltransferase component of viral defense system
MMTLPARPEQRLLEDLCRECATTERVSPAAVEKDFFLTRLIWALAQRFEHTLLLKGGTLMSKVDLGYHRMSEDVDMVIPLVGRADYKPANAREMNRVRDTLRSISAEVGFTLPFPDGKRFDKHSHVVWDLPYHSDFGPQGITLEVSLRPAIRPCRRVRLAQLLADPLAGDYANAYCWALDAMESRAEKVRAAYTRTEARDFYDLALLAKAGADLRSSDFLALVDQKLAELNHPPLAAAGPPFGLDVQRRKALEASIKKDLPAVVRLGEPPLDLDELIQTFAALWTGL